MSIVIGLTVLPLVTGKLIDAGNGYVAVSTSQGIVSVQPNGSIEYRTAIGAWEQAKRVGMALLQFSGAGNDRYLFMQEIEPEVTVPTTDSNPFALPLGVNFNNRSELRKFIVKGRLAAMGKSDDNDTGYWEDKATELIDRGAELGMNPPERYFWEKIIGRGAGGESIAKFGPYAGLSEYNGSLT